jgi:peptidyl-prolyl cis-trans isomerase B (cyclophilin B)
MDGVRRRARAGPEAAAAFGKETHSMNTRANGRPWVVVASIAAVAALSFGLTGCGSDSGGALGPGASTGSTMAASPATDTSGRTVSIEDIATDDPVLSGDEPVHVSKTRPKGTEVAVVKTSKGTFEIKLYGKFSPNTVGNFIDLANQQFYNALTFWRYEPGYVIQGGDPNTRRGNRTNMPIAEAGTGGPGWRLALEPDKKHPFVAGTVAMAHQSANPDTGGSQFFIALSRQPKLDNKYSVVGQVTKGMNVVKRLRAGDAIVSITIKGGVR